MKKVQDKVEDEWTLTINISLITNLISALNFACPFFREPLISRLFENRENCDIKASRKLVQIRYLMMMTDHERVWIV